MIGELQGPVELEQLQSSSRSRDIPLLSVVRNPDCWDLAISEPSGQLTVARVVSQARNDDYAALKTMLSQRDFDRAILIYCEENQPHLCQEIESWWIGDVEALAASLTRGDARL